MDETLIRIMTRLVRVHDEMGERCFEEAAQRALVTIARTVQIEASRRAGVDEPALAEGVLPFPAPKSERSQRGPAA
ncbi:MAG: hypothetical protein Devi2KO_01210 [Devosia indica]